MAQVERHLAHLSAMRLQCFKTVDTVASAEEQAGGGPLVDRPRGWTVTSADASAVAGIPPHSTTREVSSRSGPIAVLRWSTSRSHRALPRRSRAQGEHRRLPSPRTALPAYRQRRARTRLGPHRRRSRVRLGCYRRATPDTGFYTDFVHKFTQHRIANSSILHPASTLQTETTNCLFTSNIVLFTCSGFSGTGRATAYFTCWGASQSDHMAIARAQHNNDSCTATAARTAHIRVALFLSFAKRRFSHRQRNSRQGHGPHSLNFKAIPRDKRDATGADRTRRASCGGRTVARELLRRCNACL